MSFKILLANCILADFDMRTRSSVVACAEMNLLSNFRSCRWYSLHRMVYSDVRMLPPSGLFTRLLFSSLFPIQCYLTSLFVFCIRNTVPYKCITRWFWTCFVSFVSYWFQLKFIFARYLVRVVGISVMSWLSYSWEKLIIAFINWVTIMLVNWCLHLN